MITVCHELTCALYTDLASMMEDSEKYRLQSISPPVPLLDFIHLNDQCKLL